LNKNNISTFNALKKKLCPHVIFVTKYKSYLLDYAFTPCFFISQAMGFKVLWNLEKICKTQQTIMMHGALSTHTSILLKICHRFLKVPLAFLIFTQLTFIKESNIFLSIVAVSNFVIPNQVWLDSVGGNHQVWMEGCPNFECEPLAP